MRKIMVAGNWKMNGDRASVQSLLDGIKNDAESVSDVELAVFPPAIFLEQTQNCLKNTAISWGAQNVSEYVSGAYTGEISTAMLKDFGCRYVIVGHSERRALYNESNQDVAQKFVAAVEAGLRPILCVGETREEREGDQTEHVVNEQLQAVLSATSSTQWQNAVVAYEPVWAIGTGLTATPEQAQAVHAFIRSKLAEKNPSMADVTRILYGGSVKPDNAGALFAMPDIDGGLVGGASLKAELFIGIARQ